MDGHAFVDHRGERMAAVRHETRQRFGARLRQARIARRLTQKELGDTLGVIQSTVHYWEIGRSIPDVHDLIAMSAELRVTVDWLLTGARRGLTKEALRSIPDQS